VAIRSGWHRDFLERPPGAFTRSREWVHRPAGIFLSDLAKKCRNLRQALDYSGLLHDSSLQSSTFSFFVAKTC
jgi:hypothetical protein